MAELAWSYIVPETGKGTLMVITALESVNSEATANSHSFLDPTSTLNR